MSSAPLGAGGHFPSATRGASGPAAASAWKRCGHPGTAGEVVSPRCHHPNVQTLRPELSQKVWKARGCGHCPPDAGTTTYSSEGQREDGPPDSAQAPRTRAPARMQPARLCAPPGAHDRLTGVPANSSLPRPSRRAEATPAPPLKGCGTPEGYRRRLDAPLSSPIKPTCQYLLLGRSWGIKERTPVFTRASR